ncbi:MAG: hypothetical protein KC445_06350 [Anaerolineales bacterium]|nr:hypothetical protein [Anaerolineales bacterium]
MQPPRLFWVLIIIAIFLIVLTAILNGSGLIWLLQTKEIRTEPIEDIAKVLASLLALSKCLAIKRLIEALFDFFEQSIEEVAKLGSIGGDGINWSNTELKRAWQAVEEASQPVGWPSKQ